VKSWIWWCLLSVIGMGAGGVFQKLAVKTWDAPGRIAIFEGLAMVFIVGAFSLFFTNPPRPPLEVAVKASGWACLAGVCSAVAVLGALMALRTGQVSLVSPMLSTYVVLAALLGWLLLGEQLKAVHVAGIACVLTGAVLLSR